jgi:hypothetical protein
MLGMKLSREHLNAAATAAYDRTTAALKGSSEPRGCAELCRRLNRTIDDEFTAMTKAGAAIACAAGCDYCCHLRVGVFTHEAVALHHHLRTRASAADAPVIEQRIRIAWTV